MRDLISEIAQTIRNNKLRTALTGLSVSWGIFMLIVLLSMARGVTNNFEKDMREGSEARIQVWGGMTSKPYHGNREGRRIRLKEDDMTAIKEQNPEVVSEVSSIIYGSGNTISTNKTSISASADGVYPEQQKNRKLKMLEGRFINDRDMVAKAKVMVLSEEYAKQLFPNESALGKRVNYNGLSFVIIGVASNGWSRDNFIPFTTARMMASDQETLGSMTINLQNVKTEADGTAAEEAFKTTLANKHDFDPDDTSAVWLMNAFNNSLRGQQALSILNIGVWILGILTLLTGIVGISNIMFVSVRERTHEIGIRRAIGAKPRAILTQVIAESVAITVLFGYIGIVLGTAVSQVIAFLVKDSGTLTNPTVSLTIAFEVTLVLVIAGAVAGLFPALRALKVKPVEALRDE